MGQIERREVGDYRDVDVRGKLVAELPDLGKMQVR